MTTSIYGWCGKILKIDLSESRISELKTMDYADRFLGGRGIATRIYWEEVGPSVSAFDPEKLLNPDKAIPTLNRCAEYGRMRISGGQLPHPELERF